MNSNFLVDVAFDGEEAIVKMAAHEYDAVICERFEDAQGLRGDFYLKARELRPAGSGIVSFS